MRKLFSIALMCYFSAGTLCACTTFFINKNGQFAFGRNYDWLTDAGMVCSNLRGLAKTSMKMPEGSVVNCKSKYRSITFNQYGKEFPNGGMNDMGLVVEMMWLDGSQYPKADKRPSMYVLQWIQYQLDNCSTIDELIATDKSVRIASKGTAPLHYLAADASGNAATIEFFEGKMTVHKGKDLPFAVLTNDNYSSSVKYASALAGTSNASRSFTTNSLDRFATACNMVKSFNEKRSGSIIDHSFNILNTVAQGSHTKWSIVYDITNRKISFKTLGYPQVKNVDFSAFNFNCATSSKAWDMNQAVTGDIAGLFADFSLDLNSKIVNRSFDESTSEFVVGEAGRKQTWEYAGSISCKN